MPFVSNNGTRIWWEESGSGEPLLLIMGLGYALDLWHRTRPAVSKHFRTILFDNRGVGRSDCPPGPYTMTRMAADAAAVLDAAGVESAHVFGLSMGGMIAQEFAFAYPGRVRRLVLGCTACGGPKAVKAEPEVVNFLLGRGNLSMEDAIAASIPFIYDPSTPRERIEEDLVLRRRVYPSRESYMAQLQAILGWQSYDRLSSIEAPALVIHGESDRLVPLPNGRLVADGIPGARWLPLARASHLFTTDQPEAAHAAILDFLREA